MMATGWDERDRLGVAVDDAVIAVVSKHDPASVIVERQPVGRVNVGFKDPSATQPANRMCLQAWVSRVLR